MTRSQGRLKEQVQETVREIPVQAARLALFGVGRTLLLTDRVRKDYKEAREAGLRPVLERWRDDAGQLAGKVMGRVAEHMPTGGSSSKPAPEAPVAHPPGPGRKVNTSLAAEDAGTAVKGAAGAATESEAGTAAGTEAGTAAGATGGAAPVGTPAPDPAPAPPAPEPTQTPGRVTKLAAGSLPVPDYDEATLASVRARLRTLSAAQVSQLRDYEQEHKARADFMRMYENRIAKLTSGS
jgi:hypothetical protein